MSRRLADGHVKRASRRARRYWSTLTLFAKSACWVPYASVMLAAAWFTASATGLLAIFAVVTAVFAIKAFGKQSGQLELQRDQLNEQRPVNSKQIEVLELQSGELNESLGERRREADERRRAQAEYVNVTWTNNKPNLGETVDDTKSMVTVINGSRRPIRDVSCKAYSGFIGNDGHDIPIELDYSAELIPDPRDDSFTFPQRPYLSLGVIGLLRGGARAGFQFQERRATGPLPRALVNFTDNAGNRWSLTSGMSLRPLESPAVSPTPAAPSTTTSLQP